MKYTKAIKDGATLLLGSIISASAVFFFLMPSGLSVGSISGFAIVLAAFIPLSVSTLTLILNVILLLLGWLLIGPEFSGKTVVSTLLFSGFLSLFEGLMPNFISITGDPFVDMICFIFVLGFSQALLFNAGASSGGLDIVAKILNKFFRIELGKAVSVGGMVLALSAIFAFDLKVTVLSVLGTYLNGLLVDHFIFGLGLKRRVCILSKKDEEILQFILSDLHSGASIYYAEGAYTGQKQREIIAIVDKQEYRRLMDYIEKTDPAAFVTVYSVSEVIYRKKIV